MATQRGGSWQGTVYSSSLPQGRARRAFDTKNEAEAWELDSRARLKRGLPIDMGGQEKGRRTDGKPHTLSDLVEYVFQHHWKAQKGGEKALINARSIVKVLGPSLPLAKLGRAEIDKARERLLKGGNQPSTVNRKIAALSLAYTLAVDLELVDRKPRFPKYQENEHRVRRLTEDEERTLAAYFERLGNQEMADYVVLSLDTGLRQGELLGLQFRDTVGGKARLWGQETKSGRSRVVPMTRRAQEVIERRAAGQDPSARVLPGLEKRIVTYEWNKARAAMGLTDDPQFVPHVMRHEFCSRLADRGRSAPEIMALAGHSGLAVSQRYIHLAGATLEAAVGSLDALPVVPRAEQADVILQALGAVPREQLVAMLQALTATDVHEST